MKTKDLEILKRHGVVFENGKYSVGGSLYLRGTGITSLPDNMTVGGYLYLRGTGITSLPDNLTVGGSLYLRGTGITSLPDNLTVGDSLDLEGTGITSLPDNLTVGGSLDLRGTGITNTEKVNKNVPTVYFFRNRKYIKADGIFSEIINERGKLFKIRSIGAGKVTFLITDGQNHWSHGDTLKEAKDDLIFKVCDRNKSDYESLTLESELTHPEAITCYRVVTGACSFGTKDFVNNRLNGKKKAKYTIAEIIAITVCEYGNSTFSNFFKQKVI